LKFITPLLSFLLIFSIPAFAQQAPQAPPVGAADVSGYQLLLGQCNYKQALTEAQALQQIGILKAEIEKLKNSPSDESK
jgi:hypothetical protein